MCALDKLDRMFFWCVFCRAVCPTRRKVQLTLLRHTTTMPGLGACPLDPPFGSC